MLRMTHKKQTEMHCRGLQDVACKRYNNEPGLPAGSHLVRSKSLTRFPAKQRIREEEKNASSAQFLRTLVHLSPERYDTSLACLVLALNDGQSLATAPPAPHTLRIDKKVGTRCTHDLYLLMDRDESGRKVKRLKRWPLLPPRASADHAFHLRRPELNFRRSRDERYLTAASG